MADKAKEEKDEGKKKKSAQQAKREKLMPTISRTSTSVEQIRGALNTEFKAQVAPVVQTRPVTVISTGILSMDLAVGNGGLVAGRVMDVFGWEGTGKTLACMTIGGYIQRCDKIDALGNTTKRVVAFLDAEGTFSAPFARSAGLDPDNLILIQSTPERIMTGEDYFDTIVKLIALGVDYVIVDSCPALTPSQVMLNAMGQGQRATHGNLMSQGLNKITPLVNASGQTLVHFINQKRMNPAASWGSNPEQETGGNALKFYSSYRFEIVKAEDLKKKVLGIDGEYREKVVGCRSMVEVIKNKTAPLPQFITGCNYHFDFDVYFEPFKDETGMEYHRGVDVVQDYISTGLRTGVIKQTSSYFSFGDIKSNGLTNFKEALRGRPEVLNEIRGEVFDKLGGMAKVSAIQ